LAKKNERRNKNKTITVVPASLDTTMETIMLEDDDKSDLQIYGNSNYWDQIKLYENNSKIIKIIDLK